MSSENPDKKKPFLGGVPAPKRTTRKRAIIDIHKPQAQKAATPPPAASQEPAPGFLGAVAPFKPKVSKRRPILDFVGPKKAPEPEPKPEPPSEPQAPQSEPSW